MGLEYVDIFYHHRPDPETPMEESMGALNQIVRSGKALYVGISQYNPEETKRASEILRKLGTPCLLHQPKYNMFDRWIENGLTKVLTSEGIGSIVFSPLAQGLLTDRYLNGIPSDSRAGKEGTFLQKESITDEIIANIKQLNEIAEKRNQSLAQMSIAWVLRLPEVTSALVGASKVSQIENAVKTLNNLDFADEELDAIENILKS
jgi:L-glyceraldehyde 3-phosphate reductase